MTLHDTAFMTSHDTAFVSSSLDFGGPSDFTENMSRYFADDFSDLVGDPVDMSTPPHALNNGKPKDPEQLRDVAELRRALQEETTAKNSLEKYYQSQLESLKSSYANTISNLRSSHAVSTQTLYDRLSAAEEKESGLKSELESLEMERFENLKSSHAGTTSDMSGSHEESAKVLRERLSAAEEREYDLKAEVETLGHTAALDRETVQALTSEVERLKSLASSHAESMKSLQESLSAAEARESDLKVELEAVRVSSSERRENPQLDHVGTMSNRGSSYEASMDSLRQRLSAAEGRESDLKTELEAVRNSAREVERLKDLQSSYEESIDLLRQSLFAAEERVSKLKAELEAIRNSAHDVENSKDLPSSSNESVNLLRRSLSAAEERESNLKAELEAVRSSVRAVERLENLQSSYEESISSLRQSLSAARERDANLSAELEALRSSAAADRENVHALAREVGRFDNLKSAPAKTTFNMRSRGEPTDDLYERLSAAEERESDLKAEIEKLRSLVALDRSNVHALTGEVERLESVIAAKDEVAAELDQQLARTAAEQEQEWQRRMDALLKERNHMAKVLMYIWGEKEVGESRGKVDENGQRVKQGYRYKYHKGRKGAKYDGLFDI